MKRIKDFALFLIGCLIAFIVPILFIVTFAIMTVASIVCAVAIILVHAWAACTYAVIAMINGDDIIASIRRSQRITRRNLIKRIKIIFKF